jgi:iron complex transport system permease protein
LLVLVPSILLMVPRFRTLQLGDAAATALGDRPEVTRTVLLALGAATAGVAVAVAGPVGFVALMVPHAARMLLGSLSGGVLVVTGLLGGLLVLVSDLIAQHALPTLSLPVGVVTAAVGAPYFLFLLHRTNRGHR